MKYNVSGYVTMSVYKLIEAPSLKEAKRIFEELAPPSLCHQCASAGGDDPCSVEANGFDDEVHCTDAEEAK